MVIAGAGGHALEIFDVLLSLEYMTENIFFYDDLTETREINNCKVLKNIKELEMQLKINKDFCLGIGNPSLRKKMYSLMINAGGNHTHIVSPLAYVSDYVENNGTDIMPFCFISSNTILGKGNLINTRANMHHEVVLGSFNEIAPSANLLGKVEVGNLNAIGAASTILPGIKILNNNIIGAGALVTKDLKSNSIVKGVPAK